MSANKSNSKASLPSAGGAIVALAGIGICLSILLVPRPAPAQEFRLNVEPAAAIWLDDPQGTRFTPGFYGAIRPGLALGRIVTLQASYAIILTPSATADVDLGMAHFVTGGIRLRPFGGMGEKKIQLGGLFVDGNLGYVRTGELDRFGFDTGLGYNFQVSPAFALGPVARYAQIVQPNDIAGQDPNDAQLVTVGLNFAFGTPYVRPADPITTTTVETKECPVAEECPEVAAICKDSDKDGLCDVDDRCPNAAGPQRTMGCPVDPCGGSPLVVLVQFPYDSAALPAPQEDNPQTMDPVLNAVANAIAQDASCRVCIIGNASEEGADDHNLVLSKDRAAAVQGYLTARGIAAKRLPTQGLGASCQLVPEASRVLNRRVEFRRLQEGEACPTDCSK